LKGKKCWKPKTGIQRSGREKKNGTTSSIQVDQKKKASFGGENVIMQGPDPEGDPESKRKTRQIEREECN